MATTYEMKSALIDSQKLFNAHRARSFDAICRTWAELNVLAGLRFSRFGHRYLQPVQGLLERQSGRTHDRLRSCRRIFSIGLPFARSLIKCSRLEIVTRTKPVLMNDRYPTCFKGWRFALECFRKTNGGGGMLRANHVRQVMAWIGGLELEGTGWEDNRTFSSLNGSRVTRRPS